ncbi:ERCC4 domain-containing protein [Staphylotrichum tortipilum]|uniref:ERCC4 domain-containing protein n=1 Tax=Staphylotrichum tortipilum TaxID=2831512 RepID=A0AAN6MT64_9PEZI|nr:ERCC4 domain-containing protein [Staphylotrichum longicolle]
MPPKVISLLSASEESSPAVPRPRQQQQQQQHPPPPPQQHQKVQQRQHAGTTPWDSSDPFSSPAIPAAANHGRPASAAAAPVWIVSDDDDDIDTPASKRRRVEAPTSVPPPHCPPPCPPPPVPDQRRCDSSPPVTITAPPTTEPPPPKPRLSYLDDDPFASSSPLVTTTAPPPAKAPAPRPLPNYLDDDPFASSSPRQNEPKAASPRLTRPAIRDEILPFSSSSPVRPSRPSNPTQPAAGWDPISSSVPLPAAADDGPANPPRSFRRTQSEVITLDDSDSASVANPDSDDDFPDITSLARSNRRFPSLPKLPAPPPAATTKTSKKSKSAGAPSAKPAQPKKTSLGKETERAEKAAAREAEKERKRLERERVKEERAHDKARAAALAEVNKIRTDKKVSTPEMIVDLPTALDETVKLQAETLLHDLDVQFSTWPSPVANVVKWRRKVRSKYNDELGHWEPVPERVEPENHVMVIIPAAQFVDLALGEDTASLESHVLRMKRHFPTHTIIYLLEGVALWLRKNRNVRNRQFVSAVRSGLEPPPAPAENPPPPSQAPQRKRKRKPTNTTAPRYIDEATIDTALLRLQVQHRVLIHHTALPLETAQWIAVFTQHISTALYRRQRDAANDAAGFCIESGQVRSGDSPRDTYVRMLQEIGRVTAAVAYGVAAEFGTVGKLVRGLEVGGPLRLEKVPKGVNRDGEVSERATIGQAVSRRVYKIFTGRDEGSTDI